jgi:hypothetical protein
MNHPLPLVGDTCDSPVNNEIREAPELGAWRSDHPLESP